MILLIIKIRSHSLFGTYPHCFILIIRFDNFKDESLSLFSIYNFYK